MGDRSVASTSSTPIQTRQGLFADFVCTAERTKLMLSDHWPPVSHVGADTGAPVFANHFGHSHPDST